MYKRLKSDEYELSSIEAFTIIGITGISMLTIWTVLMAQILPKFVSMFYDLGVELPLSTRILVGAIDAFQTYWWVGLLIVIIGGVRLRQRLRLEAIRLEANQSRFNRLRVKLSPKHLIVSIGLGFVIAVAIIGFSAVAMIQPIFEANQLLSG